MSARHSARCSEEFRRVFGDPAEVVARAPGRVNLIGDHVDYAGGPVMPIAIGLETLVAVSRSLTDESSIRSVQLDRTFRCELRGTVPPLGRGSGDFFANYVTGPIQQLRADGIEVPEMNVLISSTIPMGGGLSSSAALEVGVVLAVRTLLGEQTGPLEMAIEAREAEHAYAGTPCGIMDVLVSAAAREDHACLIDCRTNLIRHVRMPSETECLVLVTDTETRHELNDGAYADRLADCRTAAAACRREFLADVPTELLEGAVLPERIARRARHVVGEAERVRMFAKALEIGDLEGAGQRMFESHDSLVHLHEVSCPELDLLVEAARDMRGSGVLGSRMTGGGFGGCTVTMCRPGCIEDLTRTLDGAFRDSFRRSPVFRVVRASGGASIIRS